MNAIYLKLENINYLRGDCNDGRGTTDENWMTTVVLNEWMQFGCIFVMNQVVGVNDMIETNKNGMINTLS